ncbi:aminotransferase class V-fold PLP-dependent enzyme [Arthrobacter roseus]|uniref:aminotransferase class V-fold PLP-dependent enzyme n=1 Tax=Arthrobacter roseus TaxID=136274 RepID=UPI00196310DC|nr:aminotransferase class V-fold PLP-dependent enzyme [Arthrobacter roseus]MBM7847555.1 cysteine desulfurase family protein (TIGR01976 family) [Arthrobacter roseus]
MSMNHDSVARGFDINAVRSRFTSLREGGFTFFDAPAGSQVPDEVGDAMARLMREASGNTGGYDPTAQTLTDLVTKSRERAAEFFGGDADNIAFGGSMTALTFILSRAATRHFEPGDEIIVTRLDHEGNVAPWRELAIDRDFVVRTCNLTEDFRIDVDHLGSLVTDRTKIIAFPWAANTVGSIADIAEICEIAHSVGAIAWVDAVHYAAHQKMDVRAVGADVVLASPYKLCGPHMGMAHLEPRVADQWRAYKVQAREEHPLGGRFENGTRPFELLAGLCASLDYIDSIGGFEAIEPYERSLAHHFLNTLSTDFTVYGPPLEQRVPTFLLTAPGIDAETISRKLVEERISVWKHNFNYEVGLPEVLPFKGEAVRVGIAHYNTFEEIDHLCSALAKIAK